MKHFQYMWTRDIRDLEELPEDTNCLCFTCRQKAVVSLTDCYGHFTMCEKCAEKHILKDLPTAPIYTPPTQKQIPNLADVLAGMTEEELLALAKRSVMRA